MFRFRLQKILELRRIEVDRLRLVVTEADRARAEASAELERAGHERAAHDARCREEDPRPISGLSLRARLATSTSLAERERRADAEYQTAGERLRRARTDVLEAHRKVRALERLRARRHAEHVAEIEAQDRKELDDIQGRYRGVRRLSPATPARRSR